MIISDDASNVVSSYTDIPIFNFAKDVGIQLTSGQADILQTWYTPSLTYATGKYQEIPATPKVGWLAVGRRGGSTTMAALIVANDAIRFVQDWPKSNLVNTPYFVLMVPTNDQVAYVQPLIKQLVHNAIKKDRETQKHIDPSVKVGLDYEASRDCITIWDNSAPGQKVRIIIRPATTQCLRGCAARTVVMDTMAYFKEPEETYMAVRPSIVMDGCRMLVMSSPHKDPKNFFNTQWHAQQKIVLQQEEERSLEQPGTQEQWNKPMPCMWVGSFPTWALANGNPSMSVDAIMKEQLRFCPPDASLVDFALEFGAHVPRP